LRKQKSSFFRGKEGRDRGWGKKGKRERNNGGGGKEEGKQI